MEQDGSGISPVRFGRYILLDRLGKGGMAEVFRAVMPGAEGFKRTLVLKRILPRFNESPRFVDLFVREARIGALLNHPSIVQVYDFGSVEGQYYIAMEYLGGRDVLAVIRRLCELGKHFPVPVAVFIAHEVARCLGYAHALAGPDGRSLNIVHRDVSPSNIMCLREGGVKLLDFGIAQAAGELATDDTQGRTFDGKLAYMAPERLRNQPIDGRADLYGVGVVLWEMLTGRRLFLGRDEAETLKNVLYLPVPPPSARRSGVPIELNAIVLRALARDPAERYATGHALADDLERILRATAFKSSMLPDLLVELFGAALRSSPVALSCVSAELLAETGAGSSPGSAAGSAHSISPPAPARRRGVRRRRVVVGSVFGTIAVTAAVLVLLGLSPWRVRPHAAASSSAREPPAAPAAAVPTAAAVPAPTEATPVAAPAATAAAPATATPAPPPAGGRAPLRSDRRRSGTARAHSPEDAISGGLSIDPFAEASGRERR